jgi:hypothetical protein
MKKETWKPGKTGECVVTETPHGFDPNRGHCDTEYYGGYLIAESIACKKDIDLISAAPDLLDAIQYYFEVLEEVRGKDWDSKPDHVLSKMIAAVKKAKGQE